MRLFLASAFGEAVTAKHSFPWHAVRVLTMSMQHADRTKVKKGDSYACTILNQLPLSVLSDPSTATFHPEFLPHLHPTFLDRIDVRAPTCSRELTLL